MIIVILFSGRLINREKDNSHENISEKKDEDNDFEMDIVAEEEKMNKIKDEEKNEQKKKEEQGTLYNIITDNRNGGFLYEKNIKCTFSCCNGALACGLRWQSKFKLIFFQ